MDRPMTKLFPMVTNGRGEPVQRGKAGDPEWTARLSRHVVVTPLGSCFHGEWFEHHEADRYARSISRAHGFHGNTLRAVVVEVAPYYYLPRFGFVDWA